MNEPGLLGYIRALQLHHGEFGEVFAAGLVQYGVGNYVELLVEHLKRLSESTLEYLRMLQQVVPVLGATARGRKALVDSGALNLLVEMALEISDPPTPASIANDERQVALAFLVDIWRSKPEVIQARQQGADYADAIVNVLKKGCREFRSKAVSFTAINLSFCLLDAFAKERNMYAPILYKAMTFILIDCFINIELRNEIVKHFVTLFRVFQNMPIQILCEPLLKQIALTQEK